MLNFLVGVFLLYVASSVAVDPLKNLCVSPQKPGYVVDLDSKMKLQADYNLEGTFTDWLHGQASYFVETSLAGQKAISSNSSRFVQLDDQFYSVNQTDCLPHKEIKPFNVPQSILDILNITQSTSVFDIVNGFLDLKIKGTPNDTSITAGIEGVGWITCINGTKTALQVDVVYTGDKSIPPASPYFKNPQLLFIHFKEYSLTDPNGTFTNSYSFSLDKRMEVSKDNENFKIPRGVLCEGRNSTPGPANFEDPVNLIVQNNTKDQNQTYELFYSPKLSLVVVTTAEIKKGQLIPFFNVPATVDATTFVHDYSTGYEYALSTSRCVSIQAIDVDSREVLKADSRISMRPLSELLLNVSSWQTYDKPAGDPMTVYKARGADGNVIELQMIDKETVIRRFLKGGVESPVVTLLNYGGAPQIDNLVRECYANQYVDDASYVFTLKDQSLGKIYESGEQKVTQVLSQKLQDSFKVNKYRIKAAYNANSKGGVDVFFRVANKNIKEPTTTMTSFDYPTELATDKFFVEMEKATKQKDWPFTVDDKTYTIEKASLARYPLPPPAPSFQGYTGSSMFIMGLFSLVFGAAIGAGALFFVTRRQRISTLAYQVFE